MPTTTHRGATLHYEIDGPALAPALVMSNSLGTTLAMWAPQMAALTSRYRVLRYDTRGHGRSTVGDTPFDIARLGEDVLAIMDDAGIAHAHFCGLSMGGMTGMWLAAHRPDRFDRFVLANTAALIGPPSVWDTRIATVRRDGMAAIVPAVLERWFTEPFRRDSGHIGPVRDMLLAADPEGYAANCAAVRDGDLRAVLPGIAKPVLVIAGEHDLATTAAQGREVASAIPGARFASLEAAHLSNWELPEAFGELVMDFLG